MAGILDLIDQGAAPQAASTPAPPSYGDLFSQGLRQGGIDMRGKLHKLAGTAMDAGGFDGAEQHAASLRDQGLAQEAGRGLVPFNDVHDVGSGLRWAAGTAGGMVPAAGTAIGAGLLTGGGALPAMLAGSAALAPMEVGGQLQRQDEDPANAGRSAGDRLGAALLPGLGASALQNIVPAGVAGRLAGKVGEQSLARIGLRAAADVPANAVASAGAEGVRQYGDQQLNPNATYNPDAIKEAGIEGGAVGALFGGVGAAGHLAHSAGGAVKGAPGRALDAVKGLAPDRAVDAVKDAAKDPLQGLRDLHQTIKDGAAGIMDKMANGEEIVPPSVNDADPVTAARAYDEADRTTLQKAQQWGQELLNDNLGPEKTAQVKQWLGNVADKASQMGIAGMKRAQQAVQDTGAAISRFSDAVNAKVAENQAGGTKKSMVYEGTNKVIGDAVRDVLGPDHPALQDPKKMNQLAGGLRTYIEQVASGRALDSFDKLQHLTDLFDVLGDQTTDVLKAVHDAVGGATKDETETFKTLGQIDAIQAGRQGVLETMTKNLKPELQDAVRPTELKAEAEMLDKWAQNKVTDPGDVEKAAFTDGQIKRALEHRYGDKAELVMKAVEKNVKHETNIIDTADMTERTTDDGTSSVKFYAQNKQLYLDPSLDKGKNGFEGAAAQRMKTAQKQNPDASVQFRKASEIGMDDPMVKAKHADLVDEGLTHGLDEATAKARADKEIDKYGAVTAEASKQETAINSGELKQVSLDAKKFGASKSRVDAGDGVILDAVKLGEFMNKKLGARDDYTAADNASGMSRKVRMFMEGVAAVQAHLGRSFEIPASTVIDRNGVTWGQVVRRMKSGELKMADHERLNGEEGPSVGDMERKLVKLRDEYKAAQAGKTSKDDLQKLKDQGTALSAKIDDAKQAEHLARFMEDQGITQADPRGPLSRLGENPKPLHTDERGESLNKPRGKVTEAEQASAKTAVKGREMDHSVTPDRAKLGKDTEAPPSPKALAAKQAAFTEKARSGDKALIDTLSKSDDAKGLQRAVEHLVGKTGEGFDRTADTINARLSELVQAPGQAYGLQTKKYSLQSDVLHASLGRPGFAATHDSPHKFDGKFDWRSHALKGEGAMVKGAGTYVSTSEGVHGYYKEAMTRVVARGQFHSDPEYAAMQARYAELKTQHQSLGRDNAAGKAQVRGRMDKLNAEMEAYVQAKSPKSPTYHLSVDIAPEHLMNWDRPLSEQSAEVQAAGLKAIKDNKLDSTDKWKQTSSTQHEVNGLDGELFHIRESGKRFFLYDEEQHSYGTYESLEAAKKAATDQGLVSNHEWDLDVRGEDLYRELSNVLGGDHEASDYLQSLGILGHRMRSSSKDGDANPNYVIYDDSKIHTNYVHFDQTRADPNATGPIDRQPVMDYLDKVHGDSIAVAWAGILHAGEFERTATGDVMRLSVHSLNPLSVAYHESLHGFFAKLNDARQGDIRAVLEKAGSSAPVMNQLRALLHAEPDALRQLADPEERAAYMYQFWAQGKLTVGSQVQGVFARIAQFIRSVTGMWTNDERAEQIMNYFHSGEYEKTRSDPGAVHRALMESGTNKVFEKVKAMTEPFRELGETLASAGGARMRDSGIPALRELADAMKLKHTTEGGDQGYMPAARAERARRMNQIGSDLHGFGKDAINEALEAMQAGTKPQSLEARKVAQAVHARLDQALTYMQKAGVNIDALGMKDGVRYFPRAWDAGYISAHQAQFKAMIDKYVANGQYKGDPVKLMQKLMVTDGAEFHINVDGLNKPGMQNAKERILSFIDHADAAPFMRKNMFEILNSYMTQATRRAEWAQRFGDDGAGVKTLMERAKAQGATQAQLEAARHFVSAVDGTLGDTINPTARRMMGNMIVYQNLRLLPLAIFSSAVDSQGIIVRGGTVGEAFKTFSRGMKEMVKNFQKDPTHDRMTELAETLGTVDSAMLIHTLGASYSQGMVGDRGRMINDTFFRFNLMEQYNTSMRVGATEAAMNFLVRHATKPGEHSERFLRELGLEAKDVQVGADGRPKLLESDGLSLEHAAKMKAAVNRWVDGAILRPDAVDKPIWMSDPHYALVAHLKQFVYSFHETILKRVAHEAKNGNYSPAMALASYVPMMVAADMVKGLIQGGGSQPSWKDSWGPEDYLWSGMERAGLFGAGQFGIDAAADVQRGGSGFGALTGPTIEQLTDAVKVLGGREQFRNFTIKSMPANALYAAAMHGEATDPKFAD